MKEKYSVYLAGGITGLSYKGTVGWREQVIHMLPDEIVAFSPMRAKQYLSQETKITDSYESTVFSSQRGLFARDMWDCRRHDAILANLWGAGKVSIGTVMEITAFWWQQKPIVLLMEKEGNVHDHAMLREACPIQVYSLEEAVHALTVILTPVGH